MYLSHMYPTADGDTLPLVRMDAARHRPRAQYAAFIRYLLQQVTLLSPTDLEQLRQAFNQIQL